MLVIGNRKGFGKERFEPHNILVTFMGMSMLWVGWYGFNAGTLRYTFSILFLFFPFLFFGLSFFVFSSFFFTVLPTILDLKCFLFLLFLSYPLLLFLYYPFLFSIPISVLYFLYSILTFLSSFYFFLFLFLYSSLSFLLHLFSFSSPPLPIPPYFSLPH